jgi:hypothetical protein
VNRHVAAKSVVAKVAAEVGEAEAVGILPVIRVALAMAEVILAIQVAAETTAAILSHQTIPLVAGMEMEAAQVMEMAAGTVILVRKGIRLNTVPPVLRLGSIVIT